MSPRIYLSQPICSRQVATVCIIHWYRHQIWQTKIKFMSVKGFFDILIEYRVLQEHSLSSATCGEDRLEISSLIQRKSIRIRLFQDLKNVGSQLLPAVTETMGLTWGWCKLICIEPSLIALPFPPQKKKNGGNIKRHKCTGKKRICKGKKIFIRSISPINLQYIYFILFYICNQHHKYINLNQ